MLLRLLIAALATLALFAGAASASPRDPAVVRLLNAARAEHGLAPLHRDARLARAAARHSRDMVTHRYFAHESCAAAPGVTYTADFGS